MVFHIKRFLWALFLQKPKQAIDFVSLILSQKYIKEYGIYIYHSTVYTCKLHYINCINTFFGHRMFSKNEYHVEAKIIQINCTLVISMKSIPYKIHLPA